MDFACIGWVACYNGGMDKPLTNAEKDKQFDEWVEILKQKQELESFLQSILGRTQEKEEKN